MHSRDVVKQNRLSFFVNLFVELVIIVAMHGETFRQLMLLAHKHGLHNGDYIFVSIPFYKQRNIFGDFSWKQVI